MSHAPLSSGPLDPSKPVGNVNALALPSGSPPFSFARMMSDVAYKRSADVNDPLNANKDWRDGYAAGLGTETESMDAIIQEWIDRGRPSGMTGPFLEWKIGFWAGRFTQMDNRRTASSNIEVRNGHNEQGKPL